MTKFIGGPCDGRELERDIPGVRCVVPEVIPDPPMEVEWIPLGRWWRDAVYSRDGDEWRFSHYADPVFVPIRF